MAVLHLSSQRFSGRLKGDRCRLSQLCAFWIWLQHKNSGRLGAALSSRAGCSEVMGQLVHRAPRGHFWPSSLSSRPFQRSDWVPALLRPTQQNTAGETIRHHGYMRLPGRSQKGGKQGTGLLQSPFTVQKPWVPKICKFRLWVWKLRYEEHEEKAKFKLSAGSEDRWIFSLKSLENDGPEALQSAFCTPGASGIWQSHRISHKCQKSLYKQQSKTKQNTTNKKEPREMTEVSVLGIFPYPPAQQLS